jgi:hypothetical protein
MNKIASMSALTLALAVSGTALAQSTTGATNSAPPAAAIPQEAAQQSALTIQKLTQDLQKAGFTEVKILQDSFLVQAKTGDGNPILMTIGPHGMSAMEVMTQKTQEPATQQLAKAPDANLTFDTSPKDHARIREIFGKEPAGAKVDHVGFSLSAGTVVPHSVHLTALPQTIVDIEPTWRGNEYFQTGDQIVIVDPRSMKILGVLGA